MSFPAPEAGSIVLNPVNGDAHHQKPARDRAVLQEHIVVETTREGAAITIPRELATDGGAIPVSRTSVGTTLAREKQSRWMRECVGMTGEQNSSNSAALSGVRDGLGIHRT